MTQIIQTREPARVVAGDTLQWQKSLSDYPASDGWVLAYRLINSAGKIDISAAASGADHLITVPAATSATYSPGLYSWQAFVSKDGERYTVGSGVIEVLPNLAAQSAGYDTRTTAKKTLDLLDAAMLARGSTAWTAEYEIAGRRMKFASMGEFMAFRDKLRAEVNREAAADRMAAGLPSRSRVLVRFGA